MPINPKLKELLTKQITDETYRTKLIETLEDAPPEVQNNWMAQDDYTRNTNDYKKKMDEFYTTSNRNIDAWKEEVRKSKEAETAALARLAELEAGGGGAPGAAPVPPGGAAALDQAVKNEIAGLKQLITDLQSKLPTEVVTKKDLDGAYQSAVGFIGDQLLSLNEISAIHQQEFGRRLDKKETQELIEFANAESQRLGHRISLDEAYGKKYDGDIKKKHDEKVAADAVEKYKSTVEVPGAGGAGPGASAPEQGPLQIRLQQLRDKDSGKQGVQVYTDWREAAAAGADELVKEGKF